jgi:hypothetical protein
MMQLMMIMSQFCQLGLWAPSESSDVRDVVTKCTSTACVVTYPRHLGVETVCPCEGQEVPGPVVNQHFF